MNKKSLFVISGLALGLSMILVFTQDDEVNTSQVNEDVVVGNAEHPVSTTNNINISELKDKKDKDGYQPQDSTTKKTATEKQANLEKKTQPEQHQIVDHLVAAFPDTSQLAPDEKSVDEDQNQYEQEIAEERARVESEIELPSVEQDQPDALSEAELQEQRYELEQQIAQQALAHEQQSPVMTSDADTDLPPMERNR